LKAVLGSSGNVRYYGDPRITASESISGRMVALGAK